MKANESFPGHTVGARALQAVPGSTFNGILQVTAARLDADRSALHCHYHPRHLAHDLARRRRL